MAGVVGQNFTEFVGLYIQVPFTSQGPGTCDPTNTTGSPPWWIPLPFITNTVSTLDWSIQLDTCTGGHAATVTTAPGTQWVKLNAGQYGFYRVNYTEPMWAQLANAAAVSSGGGTVLGSEDLAGLLDDAYQLSRAGSLSVTVFLNLIRYTFRSALTSTSHHSVMCCDFWVTELWKLNMDMYRRCPAICDAWNDLCMCHTFLSGFPSTFLGLSHLIDIMRGACMFAGAATACRPMFDNTLFRPQLHDSALC